MSVDYFLISDEQKLIMPFFTMKAFGTWQVDPRYTFDLLLKATDLRVIDEHSTPWPYEEHGFTFINSYEPYPEPAG